MVPVGPSPGRTPDECPYKNSYKAIKKVHRLKGYLQTKEYILSKFHISPPKKNQAKPIGRGNPRATTKRVYDKATVSVETMSATDNLLRPKIQTSITIRRNVAKGKPRKLKKAPYAVRITRMRSGFFHMIFSASAFSLLPCRSARIKAFTNIQIDNKPRRTAIPNAANPAPGSPPVPSPNLYAITHTQKLNRMRNIPETRSRFSMQAPYLFKHELLLFTLI